MLTDGKLSYRLETETLAVIRGVATPVPPGSILQLSANLVSVSGLVNVLFNGETVQMFAVDIQDRGTLLHSPQLAGLDETQVDREQRTAA